MSRKNNDVRNGKSLTIAYFENKKDKVTQKVNGHERIMDMLPKQLDRIQWLVKKIEQFPSKKDP